MKPFLCGAAIIMAAAATPAAAQRYSPPPPSTLSADLVAPWINQLSRKPGASGQRRLELAPAPERSRKQAATVSAFTPLQADPVRSKRQPAASRAQQASAPAREQRQEIDPQFEMQIVEYDSAYKPGTIIIDTESRFLYLVEEPGKARRYGVGVGKPGFEWAGEHKVTRKAEWPRWTPPEEMRAREAAKGKILPESMDGGPENPLGARALYLGDSLYRIHGTNQPWTIGKAVSSGCIRMRNEDVIDLYERVGVGTRVIVS
ncbi:MAG: L,D-transpeptidase [Nitratireductor sp.]|jgi:lipoprotein-anchoring transpeptidase ErfK/SrfK|nr:L,D-transpeptidase [Nitratireductor sp.]